MRIAVTGPAGAGKSRLAREIGAAYGIEVLHLDTLFWRPGWEPTPAAEWKETQRRALARRSWVVDAQYDDMVPEWFEAADLVVVLDASPLRCLWRVSRRRLEGKGGPDTPVGSEPAPVHRALATFARGQRHYRRSVRPELRATLSGGEGRRTVVVLRTRADARRFAAALPRRAASPNGGPAAPGGLRLDTIETSDELARLEGEWDDLVRAMPRPSPMLLHAWLREWLRHLGGDAELAVHVAYRDGKLVGALPLCIRPRFGLRVLSFVGGGRSALADLLVAPGEPASTGAALARRLDGSGHDFADLYGLPGGSRLAQELEDGRLRLVERGEAPVLDLDGPWEDVYRAKLSAKKRSQNRRRERGLAKLGKVDVEVARTSEELTAALEDAFALHALRWDGRPDGSDFGTPVGRRFHRAAIAALAESDVPRIVTLKVGGRPAAFHYYFALERRMYVHRMAFDPACGQFSPGWLNTLDAIEVAAAEGATRVEFLGGAERYKRELCDRFEPLYEGFGLHGSVRGAAAAGARVGTIELRKRLKRSEWLRRFYFDGLAPARRISGRVT
jgi:CelD/BcsL family acetyltransferase involved in cellulose biosynthesis/adenylate kinase family enzyme